MNILQKKYFIFFFINSMAVTHAMNKLPTTSLQTDPTLTTKSAMLTVFRRQNTSLRILDFIGGNPDGSPITKSIEIAKNFDGSSIYKKVINQNSPLCILEQEILLSLLTGHETNESTTTISPIHIVNQKPAYDTDCDKVKHACEMLKFYSILFPQTPKDLCANFLRNKLPSYNQSLLHAAIELSNYKLIEALLNHGANPNQKLNPESRSDTRTILFRAVEMLDNQSMQLLINYGADRTIKDQDDGNTTLCYAMEKMQEENFDTQCIEPLFINNKNLDDRYDSRNTLLDIAVLSSNLKAIKLLLKHGANPNVQNENGETALHLAITLSRYSSAEILLEHGANPNIQDKNGKTPLHFTHKFLIKHKANQSLKNNNEKVPQDYQKTPKCCSIM